eukprot:2175595-Prymnesium_polylepis.2
MRGRATSSVTIALSLARQRAECRTSCEGPARRDACDRRACDRLRAFASGDAKRGGPRGSRRQSCCQHVRERRRVPRAEEIPAPLVRPRTHPPDDRCSCARRRCCCDGSCER